ncbi:MAG: CoA transferase [Chloroflexota bacterium]|nr:CoA transferase [Chloroflexota bacterium]
MNEQNPAQRSLSGTQVLELVTMLTLSSYVLHLADIGADVIKVESITHDPHHRKYYPTV